MSAIVVRGMRGLGDNIMQRPFIKTLALDHDVYLVTAWPELYADIERVRFLRDDTSLRTQRKNVERQPPGTYVAHPTRYARIIHASYGLHRSMIDGLQASFGVTPSGWDLPALNSKFYVSSNAPIALVRPVTERREWFNSARNPKWEYVFTIAAGLMAAGYFVVSVADIDGKNETLVGEAPPAHLKAHSGEMRCEDLLSLVSSAAVVVGGVGWIVPACIAAGTPLFCILGGQGGKNSPANITHRSQDISHVGFATPDEFCLCRDMRHNCEKTITNLAEQWATFRQQQSLPVDRSQLTYMDAPSRHRLLSRNVACV